MKQLCNKDQTAFDTFRTFHPSTRYTYCGHSLTKPTPVIAVAWSPDGQRIASAGFDSTVQVWDAITGDHVLTYYGHAQSKYGVDAVAWSPDGKRIASAGDDVQVWNASTGCHLLTYAGHLHWHDWIDTLAWAPGGTYIASMSTDHTLQVWNASTDCHLLTYHPSGWLRENSCDGVRANTVAWSPGGACLPNTLTNQEERG